MPTTTSHIYLNTGSFGPLPTCVVQALQERIQDEWQNGRLGPAVFEATSTIYGNARSGVARLLNADVDEIALTDSTGEVLNISEVAYMGREWGIPVLIDGAQSAGAIPVDVKALGVDFYAIPMQKWLCGPDGTGALYVRRDALSYVSPTYVGYWSVKHEEGMEWELMESAQRFEAGGRQTAALAGQAAVLNWLEEAVGYQWLFERIRSLSGYTYNALQTVPGLTLLTPQPGESGLVAFKLEGRDATEVVTYLRDNHNIYIRDIPSTKSLRISTGFYNTEEETDKLVQAMQEI